MQFFIMLVVAAIILFTVHRVWKRIMLYRWDAIGTGIKSSVAMEALEGHAKTSFYESVMAIGFIALLAVIISSKFLGVFVMNPVILQGIIWMSIVAIVFMIFWAIIKAVNTWTNRSV